MTCEYCCEPRFNKGRHKPLIITRDRQYPSVLLNIENYRMYVDLTDERGYMVRSEKVQIHYCPMCGRELKEVVK